MTRLLVAGATGFIGRHVVRRAEADGMSVTVLGRSAADLDRLFPGRSCIVRDACDATGPEAWLDALRGIDAVVNAIGLMGPARQLDLAQRQGPLALAAAARAVGVSRFVQVSALGAAAHAPTAFLRTKAAADEAILADRPPGWLLVRPSLVYGPGGASARLFAALAAMPVRPAVGGGLVAPIAVDDLALAIVRLLRAPLPVPAIVDAVGPEDLSPDRMIAQYRAWLGEPPGIAIAVPRPVLMAGSRLADWAGAPIMGRDAVLMLERGATADPELFVAATGVAPVAMAEGLARHPAGEPERWAARLYFLKPALRLAIATLWIATGLLSLGVYPVSDSLALVARLGVSGSPALALMLAAAVMDLVLGVALAAGWRPVLVGWAMLAAMLGFTVLITIGLPEWWLHPFGPVTKNIPLAVAILAMIALEKRQG